MQPKEVLLGHEARLKIKAGIDKAANAVRPTLGAVGMESIIEVKGLDPIESDDGVTILRNLEFKDPYEQLGLQKLRKAAIRTSTEGGDGTATTTVLTQALVTEAFKEIETDSSKIREVRERLHAGLNEVLTELSKIKRDITEEDIEQIATISSLDPEVAKIISDIIKQVGVNGVITVEKGAKLGYSSEVVKGARFDRGYISPYFITDPATESAVLEDVVIVLVDRRLSTNEQIGATAEQLKSKTGLLGSIGAGKSILFIADDVDGTALGTLALNASNGIAKIACVRNPYNATPAREFLFDIAALTGAKVLSEEQGLKLHDANITMCGYAEKVIVTKDSTTIIGGKGGEALESRIASLKSQIEGTTSEYQKGILEDRLAALTGGIGVIRVGTYTDTDFHAKKIKFQNAINSAQAALQEGILPGGGVALSTVYWNVRERMFRAALIAPIQQMIINAGMQANVGLFRKKLDSFVPLTRVWASGRDMGYDFKTKQVVNMFDAGIIDPFKVVRLALESATAIAMSLVSKEVAIVEEEKENE